MKRVPVAHGKAQMFFHGFTRDGSIGVVGFEAELVIGPRPFVSNLADARKIFPVAGEYVSAHVEFLLIWFKLLTQGCNRAHRILVVLVSFCVKIDRHGLWFTAPVFMAAEMQAGKILQAGTISLLDNGQGLQAAPKDAFILFKRLRACCICPRPSGANWGFHPTTGKYNFRGLDPQLSQAVETVTQCKGGAFHG
jgi:hypothetical protein